MPKLHPPPMTPKSVLITGCSEGGIGGALAEAFQERGLHVFATARTPSKMPNLAKRPNVTILALDVTVQSSIAAAVEAVKAHTGGTLNYLVNNSGCGLYMPALDVELAEAKRLFDTNLWGALDVTQQFAPLLIAAGGTLVNINSITTHLYCPWISIYAASKAALTIITETLRLELSPLGVNVISVETGGVKSNGHCNLPPVKLPPRSNYLPLEKLMAASARGDDNYAQTETKIYAEKVVKDVLRGKKGRIWRGKAAGLIRWSNWLPVWVMDSIMKKGTGLNTWWFQETVKLRKKET